MTNVRKTPPPPRGVLGDERLTLSARGLFALLQHYQDDDLRTTDCVFLPREINLGELQRLGTGGPQDRMEVGKALDELKRLGYVNRRASVDAAMT